MTTIWRYLAFVVLGFALLVLTDALNPIHCDTVPTDYRWSWPSSVATCFDTTSIWQLILLLAWWFGVIVLPGRYFVNRLERR